MPTERQLAYAKQRNYQVVIDTVKEWATAKDLQPWQAMHRLVITSNRDYGGKDFDPIVADVLRVQQPKPEEVEANYGAADLAAAKNIINNWGPEYFTKDFPPITIDKVRTQDSEGDEAWTPIAEIAVAGERGDKGDKGDPGPAGPQGPQGPSGSSGGARTSRGMVWAEDLPGSDLADKLRRAWGSDDRRVIRAQHGDVLDAKDSPIEVRAGNCLMVGDAPQAEFSDNGRLNVRGSKAVFRSVADSGTNMRNTRGWAFVNVGFEGQAHLRLFQENALGPWWTTAPVMAYAAIEGCSFDGFHSVIESPLLGCTWDIRYFNNIYGPYAFRIGGSDNQLWTAGGKGDWGGANSVTGRQALIVLESMEKSTIGGAYLTGEGSACLEVRGGADRAGVDIFGMTAEGRNLNQPSAGAVVRIKGGAVNFFGGNFNFASGGAGDRAFVDVSGGRVKMFGSEFRRGKSAAPFVVRRGSGKASLFGCTDINGAEVAVTNQ